LIVEDPEEHEFAALRALPAPFTARDVLEIGCGDGRLTRRYVDEAASVVAIDPDADAVTEFRLQFPAVDARAIGIEDLVIPDSSVDTVLFAWSL
jgi:16S rRNA A1518/A1519 N6-dimethyltransferase RsmA/KsgA/DIM1 with predicted DNA glycosylase/AP lyase activity